MARRVLGGGILLAATMAVGVASAQSLPMRSGEHARFTRLTLPVSTGQPWQLGRTDDGYGLRLPDAGVPIDPSGVFSRIPRSRLVDLRRVPEGIDLILGCDRCHANAFREGGLLVIDIRDGAPPPGARFETRLAGPRLVPQPTRPGFDWTERFDIAPTAAGEPQWHPRDAAEPSAMLRADTGLARDLLARQFARAAAQGLIGAGANAGPPRGALAPGQIVPSAEEGLDLAQAALRNLRIDAQTGLDRARQNGSRGGTDRDGGPCPPDRLFDVAAWADDRPLLRQIADRRSGLLEEFDRPVPEAVATLARLYLHAGFGAEAVDVLTAMPLQDPDQALLLDLARLMDEAVPLSGSALAGHVGCDGPVALWAVLAAEDLRGAGVVDRAAVQRAFSALPRHLRRHLGPPLAQRFLDLGDTETALSVRNAIARAETVATTEDGEGLAILDAELELARGRPEAASARAAPAAAGNSTGAPEALAVMVEARIAAGQPIAPGTVNDLIALAHEHRGTPLGDRLLRLEALALTEEGRFDAAFAVRDRLRRQPAGAPAAERLTLELMARLAERAGDAALLRRALAESAWRGGGLATEARVQLATRLLEAGFPEEALDAFSATDPAGDGVAAVQARAALALGRPGQALRALAGRDGADAMKLRAEALLAMGDHRAAAGFFRDAGHETEAVRAAWLGGNWAEVARHADGEDGRLAAWAQGSMASAATDPLAPPPDGDSTGLPWPPVPSEGALAEARSLLEASAELRDLVTATLGAHPAPTR